ncbi:MAG: hypothetical protein Q9182_004958 [Xanthomendoza sp. 2 TL-2023]
MRRPVVKMLSYNVVARDGRRRSPTLARRRLAVAGMRFPWSSSTRVNDFNSEIDVIFEVFCERRRPGQDGDVRQHLAPPPPPPPQIPSKRSHEVLSSDPVEPLWEETPRADASSTIQTKKPVWQTDKLLQASLERAETANSTGHYEIALGDRWQCRDEHCSNNKDNKGYCFIGYQNKHYVIDSIHHSLWAKAISKGAPDVSIERPPMELYHHWLTGAGEVTQISRRTAAYQERQEARVEREEVKQYGHSTKDLM